MSKKSQITKEEKTKAERREEKKGFENVEKIKVDKETLWKGIKHNETVKDWGGNIFYDVVVYPGRKGYEEEMEAKLKKHQTGGRYPDELHPKPTHLGLNLFLDGFRGYIERIWEAEHEFEEHAEYIAEINEGSEEYDEEKDNWMREAEEEIKQNFMDSLKEMIKVKMFDGEEVYFKKIDVEYIKED